MYPIQEPPTNKKLDNRLVLVFLLVFISFATLIARLAVVQIAHGSSYASKEDENSIRDIPVQAVRGNIYDRNGTVIADSRVSYVAVFHEEDGVKKEDLLQLAQRLEPVLQVPYKDIVTKMDFGYDSTGKWIGRAGPKFLDKDLKLDLDEKQISVLEEHRQDRFKGVEVLTKPIRVYNPSLIAPQTVGYVRPYAIAENSLSDYKENKENYIPTQPVGVDGIEYSFEKELMGVNGEKKILIDAQNNVQKELQDTPPKQGNNLYLTLDSRVQLDLKNYVQGYLAQVRGENAQSKWVRNAYAVAMETDTGKIVSMLSYPEYDPNQWIKGLGSDDWKKIQYSYLNGTIRPAAFDASANPEEDGKHPSSIVPAGSVVKPSTELMALNEKLIAPDDQWRDNPNFRYGSATDVVHNWSHNDFGILTPQKALQVSSNTYMANLGTKLLDNNKTPIQTFQKYQHAFGLGIKTGVDLPFESSGTEDYVQTSKTISTTAAIIQASFGQQEHYSTIQLAQYAATLANKGKRLKPLIVNQIASPDGKTVKPIQPEVLSDTSFDASYWNVVDQGMRMVTQLGGTAYTPFIGAPYSVAAKTGTSQQDIYIEKSPGKWGLYSQIENATFIAYAPADHPKLAVAVVVPEGGYANEAAAFIGRAVFDIYNKYYNFAN
ncbi:MAG TPA: penicillin-binding transpeptidase domain-containing protein [Bacillota bacterium]|nr:penicillin-binding transpeptidase domain-containing protein [Bacillota bacterium]